MTRIIAGAFGGRRIAAPVGNRTRPTSDRVREALFSQLEHETDLAGMRVLDLYAGSGALGLEALSRGAQRVLFVDSAAPAARTITANIATLGMQTRADVKASPVAGVLATPPRGSFDVVLIDPPYELDEFALAHVLTALVEGSWLADDALVVVERSVRSGEPRWPEGGLTRFDDRRYGETRLWWAEAPGQDESA